MIKMVRWNPVIVQRVVQKGIVTYVPQGYKYNQLTKKLEKI